MSPRLTGFTRVYVTFGAALAILLALDIGNLASARFLEDRLHWQSHTYEVIDATKDVLKNMRALEAAHRGWVLAADAHFQGEYSDARRDLYTSVDRVRRLTIDNGDQQQRLERLRQRLDSRVAFMDSTNVLRTVNAPAATEAVRRGSASALRNDITSILKDIDGEETRLLADRNTRVTRMVALSRWLTVAGVLLSVVLVLSAVALVRVEMARRRKARMELTASEERLQDFLDTASDLIQSSTPDGTLIYANRALLATLGYSADEVIGKPSERLIAPEAREEGRRLFERIISGESVIDIDTIYLRKDGRRVHVAGSSNCRFEDGRPVATRTILHDVTRQREVDRMKDEFVSIVSHELRTPLTSIRGALGLLANGMLGEVTDRGRRMLDVAISNTDRLVRLINDILDVERIRSGAIPMSMRRVGLRSIFQHVEEVMRPYAEKAGVGLEIQPIDVDVNADSDRLVQTFTNLVSNAVKFSPAGASVCMDARIEDGNVCVRVIDDGRGIPADMLDTVFARFQQVDASDAREKGGSGLGLAISRSIVEQHGGRVWAESVLGHGSVFHVVLPVLHDAPSHSLHGVQSSAPLVLVCDDDEDVRSVIATMLTQRGYRVMTAGDGRSALELAAAHRPAVFVLDLLMPGELDGWQTMAAMKDRAETRDIPVIIVSGSGERKPQPQDVSVDLPRMRKPVDSGALVRAIEQAVTRWGAGSYVLVVEDDPDLARILLEFLRGQGLRPAHASDGREAVQLSQRLNPALIILDIMLPDTDGFAVVDWLRQHDRLRDVPIMVYSAADLDDEQRARLDIAPELLFTKSRVPPQELVERVASMVGRITWDQDHAGT